MREIHRRGIRCSSQAILDQRAQSHLDWLGTQQAEAEPRRRDPLQVVGLGEEGEHVIERPGDELLAIELVDSRVIEHHVDYYLNILIAM